MPRVKEVPVPVNKGVDPNPQRKYFLIILSAVLFLALVAAAIAFSKVSSEKIPSCGDGTFYDSCSLIKPYFCDEGSLIEKASECGCPNGFQLSGETCISEYSTEPKTVKLNYVLDGQEGSIDFIVYTGVNDYVSDIDRDIVYQGTQTPARSDFKVKSLNDETQRLFLLPLVAKIQNLTDNEDDQVRIATSIVQHIPYGFSDKREFFIGTEVNHSRYPYEVLYDNMGTCGEKSALLAFLLKEMGYETSFFYYQQENHEAVGIACPVKESIGNTGYCFIETTGPAIITDSGIEYVGGITLDSEPQVIPVSNGKEIGDGWNEYSDADTLDKIRNGKAVLFRNSKLEKLENRYGLIDNYFVV